MPPCSVDLSGDYGCLRKVAQSHSGGGGWGVCFNTGIHLFSLVPFIPCYLLPVPVKPLFISGANKHLQRLQHRLSSSFYFRYTVFFCNISSFTCRRILHECVCIVCCVYVCKALPGLCDRNVLLRAQRAVKSGPPFPFPLSLR